MRGRRRARARAPLRRRRRGARRRHRARVRAARQRAGHACSRRRSSTWLPRLPRASAIVLALCNPHRATLRRRAPRRRCTTRSATSSVARSRRRPIAFGSPPSTAGARGTHDDRTRPHADRIDDDRSRRSSGCGSSRSSTSSRGRRHGVPGRAAVGAVAARRHLQQLAVDDHRRDQRKKGRYELTKKGIAYLGEVIDEARDWSTSSTTRDRRGDRRAARAQPRSLPRALPVGLVRGRVRRPRAVPGAPRRHAGRAAVGVLPDQRRVLSRAREGLRLAAITKSTFIQATYRARRTVNPRS